MNSIAGDGTLPGREPTALVAVGMVPRSARALRLPMVQRHGLDRRRLRRWSPPGRPLRARPRSRRVSTGIGLGQRASPTAAITCGLVAVLFAWMPVLVVIGFVLGVLGLVFGMRGVRRAALVRTGRGRALPGVDQRGGGAGAVDRRRRVHGVGRAASSRTSCHPVRFEAEVVGCTVEPGRSWSTASLTNRSDATARATPCTAWCGRLAGVPDLVAEVRDVGPGETTEFEMHRSIVARRRGRRRCATCASWCTDRRRTDRDVERVND